MNCRHLSSVGLCQLWTCDVYAVTRPSRFVLAHVHVRLRVARGIIAFLKRDIYKLFLHLPPKSSFCSFEDEVEKSRPLKNVLHIQSIVHSNFNIISSGSREKVGVWNVWSILASKTAEKCSGRQVWAKIVRIDTTKMKMWIQTFILAAKDGNLSDRVW